MMEPTDKVHEQECLWEAIPLVFKGSKLGGKIRLQKLESR